MRALLVYITTNLGPSSRIRIVLNQQIFLCGYGFRSSTHIRQIRQRIQMSLIRSPVWKKINPQRIRKHVDGEYPMTKQNRFQSLNEQQINMAA